MNADLEQNTPEGNFGGDDESTLQPPPSEGTGDSFDVNAADEESPAVHDQLPSPEEYKAKMNDGNTSGGNFSSRDIVDNPQNGDDNGDDDGIHDQLPSVDAYKTSMSFNNKQGSQGMEDGTVTSNVRKSRAGLYTFLCLFLVTVIGTAIIVPVVLKNQENEKSASGTVEANTGDTNNGNYGGSSSSGLSPSGIMTGSPVYRPTKPPTMPPVMGDASRIDQTTDYLAKYGFVERAVLNDASSPQAMAANWIANKDEFEIAVPTFSGGGNGGAPYSETRFAERWALAVFYYSTGGPSWRYQLNFLEPIDHCDWYQTFMDPTGSIIKMGVTECMQFAPNFAGELVSGIEISNNNLSRSIPLEIQYLHHLKSLIIPFNSGLIGNSSLDGILKLTETLVHLEMQYCGLTGTIPESFGSLQYLTFLGLGNNYLSDTIPESFFSLTNLEVLGIDDNLLSSPIAPFAKLRNLKKLYAEDNLITGQITAQMISDGWQAMVDLDLSANRLEGPLPANIWSMPDLEVVDLHHNDFIGAIPEIESVHDKLFFFAVQDNSLDWRIPESINNLINLQHLDISANNMTIPFPSTMAQLSNLVSFHTGINNFEEHPIPSFLSGMTSLRELSMKQNKLTGQIPTFLGGLTDLQVLDLDFNQLTGAIPSELGFLTGVDTVMLNRNFLTGTIPDSFSNLVDLDVLLLDGNEITGTADSICASTMINTTFFSADCGEPDPELECSCCHLCCNDNNSTCNNFDWRVNLDGIWEYDFQRVIYSFSQELLPDEAKAVYTQP